MQFFHYKQKRKIKDLAKQNNSNYKHEAAAHFHFYIRTMNPKKLLKMFLKNTIKKLNRYLFCFSAWIITVLQNKKKIMFNKPTKIEKIDQNIERIIYKQ